VCGRRATNIHGAESLAVRGPAFLCVFIAASCERTAQHPFDVTAQALDTSGSGELSLEDLRGGCASLGLVLAQADVLALSSFAVRLAKAGRQERCVNHRSTASYTLVGIGVREGL
jgi:hypothetical protein